MKKKTVIIADDHPFFRKGIREVIDNTATWEVIAEADTGETAVSYYQTYRPDIIVLDIAMGQMNGLQSAETILTQNPNALCVMMTMYREIAYCNKAIELGVKGYLVKEDATADMLACFDAVIAGQTYISKRINKSDNEPHTLITTNTDQPEVILSDRELDILRGIAELKVNKVIARELNISVNTVQNHRRNMCQKLHLSGRQALLQYAVNWANLRIE